MITHLANSPAILEIACDPVESRRLKTRRFTWRRKPRSRRGVAVVEVAFCLPILLLVTLLFIEFTNLIFLRQSMKVASYEGIRVAIKQGADLQDVTEVCTNILDGLDVIEYEISVEPVDFSSVPRGTLTTVTIEVEKAPNQLFGLLLGGDSTIKVQSFGLKE